MTDRELMQQALEALVSSTGELHLRLASPTDMQLIKNHKALTALRERLAQPEQEPVAWRYDLKRGGSFAGVSTEYSRVKLSIGENWTPLYTAPPQRKPLTEEEIGLLTTDPRFAHIETPTLAEFARAVIAKATGEKK